LQRDQTRAPQKRTFLSESQKVIVKRHCSSIAKLLQLFFILQSSSGKFMTTLMLTAHQRKVQDLLLMVQRKGFGTGVLSGLCTCVFLQMLLDRQGAFVRRYHCISCVRTEVHMFTCLFVHICLHMTYTNVILCNMRITTSLSVCETCKFLRCSLYSFITPTFIYKFYL
jgi:hypothetical protein